MLKQENTKNIHAFEYGNEAESRTDSEQDPDITIQNLSEMVEDTQKGETLANAIQKMLGAEMDDSSDKISQTKTRRSSTQTMTFSQAGDVVSNAEEDGAISDLNAEMAEDIEDFKQADEMV